MKKIIEEQQQITARAKIGKIEASKKTPTKNIDLNKTSEYLTQFYIYLLNESTMGMYYINVAFKKFVKQLFEVDQNLLEDFEKRMQLAENLSEILAQETSDLAKLNGDWMNKMSANLNHLL